MKQLSDNDIEQMVCGKYVPDTIAVRSSVRRALHMSTRVPDAPAKTSNHIVLDLHHHTVEMAWERVMNLATSGARSATVITGASGVLKQLFPQWATESILTPYILSFNPINNGSFSVQFHKKTKQN